MEILNTASYDANDNGEAFPISIVYRGDNAVGVSLVGDMNWAWTPSVSVAHRLLGAPATPTGRRRLRTWIARTTQVVRAMVGECPSDFFTGGAILEMGLDETRHFTTFALKAACMKVLVHKMVLEARTRLKIPVEIEFAAVDRDVVPGWTPAQEARGMMLYAPVPLFLHDPRDAAVDWEFTRDDDHARDRDVMQGLDFLELRERSSTRRRRFLRLQCRHDDDDANRVVVPNDSVLEQVHRIVAACLNHQEEEEEGV